MNNQNNKTVYFVRHAQSLHNTEPVFQAFDIPLSKQGLHQAEIIATRIAAIRPEIIIASTAPRAKQTAQAIKHKTKRDIIFSDLFSERKHPSAIDGQPYTNQAAETLWRQWQKTLYTHRSDRRIGDSENYQDILNRADRALKFLENRPESSLVVVTHGSFLRTILARSMLGNNLSGKTLRLFQERIRIANAGITVLQYQDAFEEDFAWRILTLNDQSHFAS